MNEYNRGYTDGICHVIDMLTDRINSKNNNILTKGDSGKISKIIIDEDKKLIDLLKLKISE